MNIEDGFDHCVCVREREREREREEDLLVTNSHHCWGDKHIRELI